VVGDFVELEDGVVSVLLGASDLLDAPDLLGVSEPPEVPVDEGELVAPLGDCKSPEVPPVEGAVVVPDVPLGVSVTPAPPGVASPEGDLLPVQAPRVNARPNTSEKAVNFRLTIIPPKIFKIFCTESATAYPCFGVIQFLKLSWNELNCCHPFASLCSFDSSLDVKAKK
jgi:hypothetical protein